MLSRSAVIGTKTVHLAAPYDLPGLSEDGLVGLEDELRLAVAACLSRGDSLPLSPVLVGPPGVGKNRLAYELARCLDVDLYVFQGHEDVTAEDLACAARFADGGGSLEYVASPLATAMMQGALCLIDEIGKIRPRALSLLASVLDERHSIDSLLLGERIVAAPGFRFIAATNTGDLEGNMLPEFIRSRLRPVIHLGYPTADEIAAILKSRFASLGDQLSTLLEAFYDTWRSLVPSRPPAPREAISVFALATRLADHDGAMATPKHRGRLDAEHVRCATGRLFVAAERSA